MNSRTDVIPIAAASGTAWRPRLFKTGYVLATVVAMTGWLWTIGWVTFAFAKWLIA
jgi:hypothetical protein